ncbi:MAG: hydroxylamine reductase, partial [bacterium]|nr:hydroxylamine reductase [bacterium]
MFCFQCEQTAKGTGCDVSGVCGKKPDVAALQDYLIFVTKKLGGYAHRLAALGTTDREANVFIVEALFSTITNVNFDADTLADLLGQARETGLRLKGKYEELCSEPDVLCDENCSLAETVEGMVEQAQAMQITNRQAADGEDVVGLQELITYGLKGAAAYADHAQVLDVADDAVFATFNEILSYLEGNPTDIGELTGIALKVGELNLQVMELLDRANTDTFGHPEPTAVNIAPVAGKCILVSGHDLKDLRELLKQTEGKGINIYTHCEMLPANAYPELKKFSHLVGNY